MPELKPGAEVRINKNGFTWKVMGWKTKSRKVHIQRYAAWGAVIGMWVGVDDITDVADE